jgi:hypothetical protein
MLPSDGLMKAKIANLPDEDHVMRYVPWARLLRDENDNVLGFLPQAFELRPEEDGLSVNWVEFFKGDWETRVQQSVRTLRGSFAHGVGRKSAFGIANVGVIKTTCMNAGARVRIVHEPDDRNPAHSSVRRLPRDDLDLLQALADQAFVDLVQNADVSDP